VEKIKIIIKYFNAKMAAEFKMAAILISLHYLNFNYLIIVFSWKIFFQKKQKQNGGLLQNGGFFF
jgi:ABC-type spermidine/putrescine transport system permease subunit I